LKLEKICKYVTEKRSQNAKRKNPRLTKTLACRALPLTNRSHRKSLSHHRYNSHLADVSGWVKRVIRGRRLIELADSLFYKNLRDGWHEQYFRDEILKHVNSETILLDVGAGTGRIKQMNFRGVCKKVYGVDLDERVLSNPFLDKGFVSPGESMPFFPDKFFDLVISHNVLEHVDNPNCFLKEINRVLKSGGLFITKTPNKYHYFAVIARLTPTWFHKLYNEARGRDVEDTFPTFYKVNSVQDQLDTAAQNGFNVVEIKLFEGRPEYLRITFITYIIGIIYERLVNTFHLNALKVLIISKFEKC